MKSKIISRFIAAFVFFFSFMVPGCKHDNCIIPYDGIVYFDVDSNTMKYDEEYNELIPIPEEIFNAVNGQYLKVAIGKGMITLSQIQQLVSRYSFYF